MKTLKIIFIFLILFISNLKDQAYAIKINSVGYSYGENLQNYITQKFNQYAKEHNLDLELSLNLYTSENSTRFVDDFGSTIESLLKKGSTKYDIFFYDIMYSPRYSPYFLDLRDWLPKEHLAMYSSGVAAESCTDGEKWVGLPLNVQYSMLYSNMPLLNKYNKKPPKTWDELMETAKFILDKERESGNTNIFAYNGLFPDVEIFVCSIQEFIHSFRKTKDSPFPGYTSDEAFEALEKLKEMKETIASNEVFHYTEQQTISTLFSGQAIFLKFWNFVHMTYPWKMSTLVGKRDGISGSSVGGVNIGINKFISDERKKAAATILQYITNEEFQKNAILDNQCYSAMNSLYDDKDVCAVIDCEIVKNVQPIVRKSNLTSNYDEYSYQLRKYFNKFLYGDAKASDVLYKVEDLTRFYSISFDYLSCLLGFIIFKESSQYDDHDILYITQSYINYNFLNI